MQSKAAYVLCMAIFFFFGSLCMGVHQAAISDAVFQKNMGQESRWPKVRQNWMTYVNLALYKYHLPVQKLLVLVR